MSTVFGPIGLRLQTIPAGSIVLRDNRKKSISSERVCSFLLSATPVTEAQFSQLCQGNERSGHNLTHPAVHVSWLEAAAFCNRLSAQEGLPPAYAFAPNGSDAALLEQSCGYRLPTEAEWEFACRAGSNASRYGALDDIAWFADNSGGRTQPVGLKQPNAWGLFDMLGNVWEWCDDIYDPEVYGTYRVFRGGGWADNERGCLASNRRRSHPTYAIDDLGFRVARSQPEHTE
ncbi:formylglycine-generating enzyme family protein [Polycladidibacter hongkongensis]|uniref:formylglycine-generating enzyme family protein n=1 Tax=Polycladidibacter hongkongensis TaxID=1647556 RepID=UPI000832965A|nr:SUMF1/EgtB/PvdO family nonheme iron enzyme [Pseudovibrio hongkongensis]